MAIPKFGKHKEYLLIDEEDNEHLIKIKGYRASDHEMVIQLQKLSAELPGLTAKAKILHDLQAKFLSELNEDNFNPEDIEQNFISMISGLNDEDYTDQEIEDLMKSVQQIQELEGQVANLSFKLGQRGLKRFFYLEDPETRDEYLQAQRDNRLTEWIDEQEDIDVDMHHLNNVANIMIELGMPTRPLPGSGKGKQNRKQSKS